VKLAAALAAHVLLFIAVAWSEPAPSPSDLLSAGHADDAIQLLEVRTRTNPNYPESFHLLTRAYFYMERWDDAVEAGKRAVALSPDSSDYHLWLGRALGEKAAHSSFLTAVRMVGKIRVEFERAVQLNSANIAARADLAQFYLEAPPFMGGGKDKALRQAEQLASQDAAASHWVKGQLAEKAKRLDEAEAEYRAAIRESKSPAGRWLDLASFYHNTGRLDLMEQAVNKAAEQESGKSTVLFEAASLLFQSGRNFPQAYQLVQRYLHTNGPVEQAPAFRAHYLLGSILEKQGNKPAAASEYRAALSLASEFQQAREGLRRVE
jgi:tetratricopeptide (TPR) repeat protein